MAAIYTNAYLTFSTTGANNASMGLFFPRKRRSYVRFPYTTRDNISGHVLACTLPLRHNRINPYSHPDLTKGLNTNDAVPNRNSYWEALGQWYSLVSRYGRRKLTYPSDKLPAMSGIAREYSEIFGDSYVAGLWRSSMLGGLAWQSGGGCKAVSDYRAPSWSWASVDDAFGGDLNQYWQPLASVFECHVNTEGENPYGRVKCGWIKIEAPLIPLVFSDTKGPIGTICVRTTKKVL